MKPTRYKYFATVASLTAMTVMILCEVLHPLFHGHSLLDDTGCCGEIVCAEKHAAAISTVHHGQAVKSGDSSFCPICAGLFISIVPSGSVELFKCEQAGEILSFAKRFTCSAIILHFSRGPPVDEVHFSGFLARIS